jgi:peptide/nickel transport system ATP-binding protein
MTFVLEVSGLSVATDNADPPNCVVKDLDLEVSPGEVVGIVGESGSGKSITALALLDLLPRGLTAHVARRLVIHGIDVATLSHGERRRLRGAVISVVFQEPAAALNPVRSIRAQFSELLTSEFGAAARYSASISLLEAVGLSDPRRVLASYPFELSGGMKQRVLIAMALAKRPAVLLADEPTTALDVLARAEILRLLSDVARTRGVGVVLITHDIGSIRAICSRVYVMYKGRILEAGPTQAVLRGPRHPYTRALLNCILGDRPPKSRLPAVPMADDSPTDEHGCVYVSRCAKATRACAVSPTIDVQGPTGSASRKVACWHPEPSAVHAPVDLR